MKYDDFKDKSGTRFDIVEGELQESPSGLFLVSETYQPFSIYLNRQTTQAMLIAPEHSYLGRAYSLKKRDCITLVAQWLDENLGSTFGEVYTRMSQRAFVKYYREGMCAWFEDNNFKVVKSEPVNGDCIVYAYKPNVVSHAGIYLDTNKLLHHMPGKLSCIDTLDASKVLGVYRYAK